ncbi:MAG: prenyltransferase [Clostridiales Family XIII bacterium]|jgi:1,4-dihydroxy-2-naphthoate octaprenyltransferase|nr:prenyltransferase [Clostridiales Family XIII bacterium]
MEHEYTQKLTPLMALRLAAPHTWPPASVAPMILGVLLALDFTGEFSLPLFVVLLLIVVLMQSAVNTLNDYYDFVKGADRLENSDDPTDAILVYNHINPRHVLALAFAFLGFAAILGIYVVYAGGVVPLIAGVIGALVIVAYSAGKSPISYLPFGELASGLVMGGLIPFAVFAAFTRIAEPAVILYSLPCILGVGLVMMTNNLCDIERDIEAGRKTLPVLLGRVKARMLYRALFIALLLCLPVIASIRFSTVGAAMLPALILGANTFRKLLSRKFTPDERGACMQGIVLSAALADFAYFSVLVADILL